MWFPSKKARAIPALRRLRFVGAIGLLAGGFISVITIAASSSLASTATDVPDLGSATGFALLAGSGIANRGTTSIVGDIGTYPGTSLRGADGMDVQGTNHGGDAVTQGAKADLASAYRVAAEETPTHAIVADLGGQTLSAGVYDSTSSIALTGTVILDGGGDPNAIFVFQTGSKLAAASASRVSLTNGAQPCDVYWQVGGSATIGSDSSMGGTLMAQAGIDVDTGTTVDGRVLAVNGDVTLRSDTITMPTCDPVIPPPTTVVPEATVPAPTTTFLPPAIGAARSGRASPPVVAAAHKSAVAATTTPANDSTTTTAGSGAVRVKGQRTFAAARTPCQARRAVSVASTSGGGSGVKGPARSRTASAHDQALSICGASVPYPIWPVLAASIFVASGVLFVSIRRSRRHRPAR